MTVLSQLMGRLARLPKGRHPVGSEVDLAAPMRDGVTLLTDRYFPTDDPDASLIFVRSPYGRTVLEKTQGHIYASHGFQYVVQSCRGTFGSGGEFRPFRDEERDGADAVAWLRAQPWCRGRVGTAGASYLGYTQWSEAAGGADVDASSLTVTTGSLRRVLWPDEVFGLDGAMSWAHTVHHQEEPFRRVLVHTARQRKTLAPGFAHLPLLEGDRVALGSSSEIFQGFATSEGPTADLWRESDRDPDAITAPALFIAGWYDLFLVPQLEDFARLAAAGRGPSLVVGPWMHVSPGLQGEVFRQNLAWFDGHLRPGATVPKPSVRVFVMGAKQWVDLPSWPPPAAPRRLHLHPAGRLADDAAPASAPDVHTYDPADPTPSVGGPVLGTHAGVRDNRKVEARPDVLTYTTDAVALPVTIIGAVHLHLHLETDNPHIDVFARLCDVDPKGKSINLGDRLIRLGPDDVDADGKVVVELDLSSTAHCFLPGHRIRLQVTGGAHPRYARNLGTGEPAATSTRTARSTRRVFHDPDRPSWLDLPTYTG